METRRFDAFTRALSTTGFGRRTLLALLGGLLGSRAVTTSGKPAVAAKPGRRRTKRRQERGVAAEGPCGNGGGKANTCKRHGQCCTGYCHKKRRCRCKKLGQSCTADRNCCPAKQGLTCQEGSCQPTTAVCSAASCPNGCCAGDQCAAGTADGACGANGAPCQACATACIDQACVPCDVCASGCPFSSLQVAIDEAESGDTIRLCAGTYGTITIDRDLTIIGAGDGADPTSNTILNGQGQGRVVLVIDDMTAEMRNLRITGGETPFEPGGGVRVFSDATLTLTGCTVTGNSASSFGGGIFTDPDGTISLNGCAVTDNTAPGDGGGIFNNNGTVTLDASSVTDNTAGLDGGGIFNNFGTVNLINGSSVDENFVESVENNCAGPGTYNGIGCAP